MSNRGFGMLEVLVGLAILAVAFFALMSVSRGMLSGARATADVLVADYLLEEGIEAARSVRDQGWDSGEGGNSISNLSGTAYFSFSTTTSKWTISNNPEVVEGKFYRSLTVNPVYRDASDDIAQIGALDPDTKKVITNVSWRGANGTTTRSLSAYLTNYFND